MKTYTKLVLPEDSAWGRITWRRYVHWRILKVIDGVSNIVRWIPTLYRDRDWDDSYILRLLQKKIEHQREYLVKANRHIRVDEDNFWMTITLNLIERELEEFYSTEYSDYVKEDIVYNPDRSIEFKLIEDNSEAYLLQHKAAVRRMIKENYMDVRDKMKNGKSLAFILALYNQDRCRKLLYKVLERHLARWWD